MDILLKSTPYEVGGQISFYGFHLLGQILRTLSQYREELKRQQVTPTSEEMAKNLKAHVEASRHYSPGDLSYQCEGMTSLERKGNILKLKKHLLERFTRRARGRGRGRVGKENGKGEEDKKKNVDFKPKQNQQSS